MDNVTSAWHHQYQLQVTLVLPLMLFNYIKRRHVQILGAKVHEFDDTLAQMKWIRVKSPRSWCCRHIEVGLFMSSISLLLLFFLVLKIADEIGPLEFACSMVFVAVTEFYLLISFQFIFGTLSIYRRFSWLNTNVRWGFVDFRLLFYCLCLQPGAVEFFRFRETKELCRTIF